MIAPCSFSFSPGDIGYHWLSAIYTPSQWRWCWCYGLLPVENMTEYSFHVSRQMLCGRYFLFLPIWTCTIGCTTSNLFKHFFWMKQVVPENSLWLFWGMSNLKIQLKAESRVLLQSMERSYSIPGCGCISWEYWNWSSASLSLDFRHHCEILQLY